MDHGEYGLDELERKIAQYLDYLNIKRIECSMTSKDLELQ